MEILVYRENTARTACQDLEDCRVIQVNVDRSACQVRRDHGAQEGKTECLVKKDNGVLLVNTAHTVSAESLVLRALQVARVYKEYEVFRANMDGAVDQADLAQVAHVVFPV